MKKQILFLLLATLFVLPVLAQKMSIGFIYPAGGAQGSSVDIEVGGLNIKDAKSAIITGVGIRSEIIPLPVPEPEYIIGANGVKRKKFVPKNRLTDQSAPQIADRVGVRIHIDGDAEVGLRSLRLQSSKGVSNQLSFEVSSYPNFVESQKATEPNRVESLPATLCGYVKPGQIDRFTFHATKGMDLVAEVKARAFVPYIADAVPGWFQAIVKLTDSKGREVAFADDYRTSPDPVLRFKVPQTDDYTISIHDAIFRGREDFNYRIQLGEIPFVESIYPLVAAVGSSTTFEIGGRNLAQQSIQVKPEREGVNYLRVKGKNGKLSNQVPYWAVAAGESIEREPTEGSMIKERVLLYDKITTQFEQKSYKLPLTMGEEVVVDAISRRIDSRADLKLTLLTPNGDVAIESDDSEDTSQGLMTHHADPVLNYKATQAGLFTVVVEDIQGGSGQEHSYLIRRSKPSAPFEAFVSPANITLAQGGTTTFFVNFNFKTRKNIPGIGRVELEGLPDGYRVSNLIPGRFPKMWEISVTAPEKAKVGTFPIKVKVHTAPKKGETVKIVEARPTDNMMQAFYYTHYIAAEEFTAEVIPEIPYTVHFAPEVERDLTKPLLINAADTTLAVRVLIDRRAGCNDELELALGKQMGKIIMLDPVKVMPDEKEKTIYLKFDSEKIKKMKYIRYPLYITATVNGDIQRQGQRTFVNAKYKDMTPIVILQREDTPIFNPYKQLNQQKKGSAGNNRSTPQPSQESVRITSPDRGQTTNPKYRETNTQYSTPVPSSGGEPAKLEINKARNL